jgi:predicted nucleotide-binding protein
LAPDGELVWRNAYFIFAYTGQTHFVKEAFVSTDIYSTEEDNRRRKVYVVYGQNKAEKDAIDTILQKFGLESLIKEDVVGLTEGSSFIGRILDTAFSKAQAVIVLLTGEEEVRLRKRFQHVDDEDFEKEFYLQPTQDQMFEAGYAFGKSPDRTILIQIGNVRPFSDIMSRYVLNHAQTIKNDGLLRKCLQRAGCMVKDSNILLVPPDTTEASTANMDSKKVFVVHGRDMANMKELFAFLRSLDLSPMKWYEAIRLTKGGAPYVGEVVAAGLEEAKAVIILLTGDDEVRQKQHSMESEQFLYPQARPNVIFEAGMAFSRYEERTILVQIGRVRPCPDMQGRVMVRLSNKPAPRWDLMQRLLGVGCPVNDTGEWSARGRFRITDD